MPREIRECKKHGQTEFSYIAGKCQRWRCLECNREYSNGTYKTSSTRSGEVKKRATRRRQNQRQLTWDYLLDHPCVCCGESDPVVLDFDHIDPTKKLFTIGTALKHSRQKVLDEIKKCQVLCSNCHRRKTARDGNWYSYIVKEGTKSYLN